MAKIKKRLLLTFISVIAVISALMLAACGQGTKYSVTWDVSEHAVVKVVGLDSLPSSIGEEATISFTVEPATGYAVSTVNVNGRNLSADKEGKYNVVVKADIAVKVETVETIAAVTVKTNPTKLTYVAGEELDKTGMEVEVEYGTGRKATETEYSVVYKNGAAFAFGDTSFSVKYKNVESAAVDLTGAVEAKITIDPAGGTIADEYYTALQGNAQVKNLNKAENGTITFTHAALSAAIVLPSAEQWTRGEAGDYIFVDWGNNGATEVAASNETSTSFTASYKPVLLELSSLKYENQTVGEETVPYLIIKGKFKAAKTAYLYLYEGNDKVELKGDTVGSETTNRGDDFELKFDMRKLVEKEYLAKWMDIKFVATLGELTETQEIDINDYTEDFVDLEQIIVNGDYSYSFATYTPSGSTAKYLKALYSNYFKNEYTLTAGTDAEGNATLTVNGSVDEKWAGKTVCIDFTGCVDGDDNKYAVVGADGSYTLTFNFKTYKLGTDGYSHFRIVESEADSSKVLYKDGDGNLLNAGLQDEGLEKFNIGLIENQAGVRVPNANETAVFYVGRGKWGGIVLYGKNEAIATTGVSLATKNEKPMLAISGTYNDKFTADGVVEYLKQAYAYADIQNNADTGSGSTSTNPDWGSATPLSWGKAAEGDEPAVPATIFCEANEGKWTIWLDLSARENAIGELLFSHFGSSTTNLTSSKIDKNARITATVGETTVMYSLVDFTGWGGHVVCINVSKPLDFVMAYEKAELQTANDKAYFVISGTYTGLAGGAGTAADGIEKLTTELNGKRNDVQNMGDWAEKKFSKEANNAEVTVADGKWSVKIDLSALEIGNGNNLVHFLGNDLDLTIENLTNALNTVTVGGKTYKLETQNHWDRDFIIIVVSDAAAE